MTTKQAEESPRYCALMQLLRTADTVWNASRALFERWDLSPSQFNILNLLFLNPGGLSQSDLSRQLVMHRSNVTGLVDRLEKRHLLRRQAVAGDRRAYQVVLTPGGKKIIDEIRPRYFEGADRALRHLSNQRAAQMIQDLVEVAEGAERVATELEK